MKHLLYTLAIASGSLLALNANAKVGDLLPRPHQIELTAGAAPFALQRTVAITDPTGCTYLKNFFTANGCTIAAEGESAAATVTVTLASAIDGAYDYEVANFPNEGYKLSITANAINITAASPTGVIRAAQTLQQLAEGYTDTGEPAALEALSMTDWPAFKVRGWMQDVGRSFLSVDELKKEIDLYARFKVNVFHWHLTEKIGWRFEVKAYPQLTSYTNGVRYPGQYYTQEQCKEVEAYAAERGITVIPEIDMPGHSDVFKNAMGFDMQTDEGKKALKVILKEAAEVFPKAPYIHIGGDEVTIKDGFLEEMTDFVRNTLGRKVVLWNMLKNKAVTKDIADMTQMWATSGTAVKGLPNIDCRYNYINHFDVYADLVGIYKSNIYYADKGNPDIAGTISAAWNDTKVATEDDIIRQNNQYANVLASAERGWIGGGKQYIEVGGTRLPNTGDEYEEFADFERRFLFHKTHSLQGAPIPYVKQSNIRWRLTEPFPNDGDAAKAFPPEEAAKLDAVMPTTYSYNGTDYAAKQVTGGGVYLRHIWHGTVRGVLNNPANNQTCYAWTYVYSPVAQDAGAQIEFYTYSRSGSDKMPPAGKWDRRGSQVWLNGQEIAAPTWQQPDKDIPQDNTTLGLTNENFTARPVVKVHLNEGWNKVFLKLPHANSGGTARDKWQYTFVLTDTEGKNALEGITYSPDRTLDPFTEDPTPDPRPKASNDSIAYWYQFNTPLRGNRYPTSQGAGQPIVGNTTATKASQWKFVARTDNANSFDIINRADSTYIVPGTTYNAALTTSATASTKGWYLTDAATEGYFIIMNDTEVTKGTEKHKSQFNQTTSALGFKVYNWGDGNTTDAGCQYSFKLVNTELITPEPQPNGSPTLSNATTSHYYKFSSARFPNYYPTSLGEGQPVTSQTDAGTQASEWKFVDRTDGTFDIVNRHDGLYISPASSNNTALNAVAAQPEAGWKLLDSGQSGYFIFVSDANHAEINQTKSGEGYKLYNWGYGSKTAGEYRFDDNGCWFSFSPTETVDNTATDIGTITTATTPEQWYDLSGRRVARPTKGLYISSKGRKVGR